MTLFLIELDRKKLLKRDRAKNLRRAQGVAFAAMAREWHDAFLPLHFEDAAKRRYSYAARDGERAGRDSKAFRKSYAGRKYRKYGHMTPLVLTGRTRDESRLLILRSTNRWAKVVLPRGLNRRRPGSSVNMRAEATRILPSESAALRRIGAAAMKAELKRLRRLD